MEDVKLGESKRRWDPTENQNNSKVNNKILEGVAALQQPDLGPCQHLQQPYSIFQILDKQRM